MSPQRSHPENQASQRSFSLLLITGFAVTMLIGWTKILRLEVADILLPIGLLISLLLWIVIVRDIIINRVKNRYMWILGVLFVPFVWLIYLIRRNHLIKSPVQ